MRYDLHLLKAFILSPDAEPSGTTEVIFAPVDDNAIARHKRGLNASFCDTLPKESCSL